MVIFEAWDVENEQERAVILREIWEYNARYDKTEFYIKDQGQFTTQAKEFYEDHIKKNPDVSKSEFRQIVKDAYEKVK